MPQHFSAGRLPHWIAAVALASVLLAIGLIPFAQGQDRSRDGLDDLRMPLLIGEKPYRVRDFLNRLRKLGFVVRTEKGPPAPNANLVYCIESQEPAPNVRLQRGQKIVLRYYDLEWHASRRR